MTKREAGMAHQEPRYAKARRILLIVFLVSALLSVALISTSAVRDPDSAGEGATSTGLRIVTTASIVTAATTFAGFASITALMWRRDKRETQAAEIEIRKARLELEKIERMRDEEDRGSDLDALHRQLDKERKNLLLIEERKADYVMDTEVPLTLIRQERHTRERILELELRIERLR
jgi:hypothetical protein